MTPFHAGQSKASAMTTNRLLSFLFQLVLALTVAVPLTATAAQQETFVTPEAAVEALMAALKADSDPAMIAIFGEEHKVMIVQSDRVATSATRAMILQAMQALRVL